MPELKFKQIACSEAISSTGDYQGSLYGLTKDGEVYQYSESTDGKGWIKLCMDKYSFYNQKNS